MPSAPNKRWGRCTGCGAILDPGSYFTRRVVRHLADWDTHNHDAIEMIVATNRPAFVPVTILGMRVVEYQE